MSVNPLERSISSKAETLGLKDSPSTPWRTLSSSSLEAQDAILLAAEHSHVGDQKGSADVAYAVERKQRVPQVVHHPKEQTQIELANSGRGQVIDAHAAVLDASRVDAERVAHELRLLDVNGPGILSRPSTAPPALPA
jgi:hypothetical protein